MKWKLTGAVPLCPSDISPLAEGESDWDVLGEARFWFFPKVAS